MQGRRPAAGPARALLHDRGAFRRWNEEMAHRYDSVDAVRDMTRGLFRLEAVAGVPMPVVALRQVVALRPL